MTNEQKAVELFNSGVGMVPALELMAEWKDRQLKYILNAYNKWLVTGGFFDGDPNQQPPTPKCVNIFIADFLPDIMKSE